MENTEKISLVSEEAQPNKNKNINSIKNTNNMLAPEILERIFQFLVSQDLSNVLLVCRRWRDVGEAPWLWSGHNLTAGNLHIMSKLLTIRRMKSVKKLKIREVSEELLQDILESSEIRKLEFNNVDLSKIKSELIARTIDKMEEMAFYNNRLSSKQVKSIFTASCGNSSKLKKLDLFKNNLSSVEPTQLAKAVIKLEELDLHDTKLTNQQAKAIFAAIGDGSKLNKLDVSWNNISSVEPAQLAKAVIKLEELDLDDTNLTSQQTKAIFAVIGDGFKLKKLIIYGNNLSSVEPAQLAKAVINLEELDLGYTRLASQQRKAIFAAIGDGSKLKKLHLSGNNISSVVPAQLTKAVIKLEELDLHATELTSQQAKAIFAAIGDGYKLKKLDLNWNNLSSVEPAQLAMAVIKLEELDLDNTPICDGSKLKKLNLSCNNFSSVEPTQLAKAVIKLEELGLHVTKLTSQQSKAIFAAICDGSKLKKLDLNWNNLSSVEPAQLAMALIKLEELDLDNTELTSQQTTAIFTTIGDGSKLKKLDLSYNNLSSLDPAQLTKAVIKLEKLYLRDTKLTSQQATAIFAAIGDGSKLKKLYLSGNNISSVEPAQLAKAVIKLEELYLRDTELTSQQAKAIFAAIGDGSKLKKLDLSDNNVSSVEPAQLAKAVIKLEELNLGDTELTSQ